MEEARGQSTLTVMQARGESESLKLSVHIPYPTSRVVQLKQLVFYLACDVATINSPLM